MATILEGLNKISGKLGGSAEATENLEALNAIAGALGGTSDATNNADAIDAIAENASGGGGDFSIARVTLTCTVSGNLFESNEIVTINEIGELEVRKLVNRDDPWDVVMYKGDVLVTVESQTEPTVTGALIFVEHDEDFWSYKITGDCEIKGEGYHADIG